MREQLVFIVLPYLAAAAILVVPIARGASAPLSPASDWRRGRGSLISWAWRWGIGLLIAGHFVAFALPRAVAWVNRWPAGTALAEGLGLAAAGLTLGGLTELALEAFRAWRALRGQRALQRRGLYVPPPEPAGPLDLAPPVAPSFADTLFFLLLLVSIATGLTVAVRHQGASSWYADTLLPYVRSLVRLRPDLELVVEMPFSVRLHVVAGFLAIAIFPFTRKGRSLAEPWVRLRYRSSPSRRALHPVPERKLGLPAKIGLAATALVLGALGLLAAEALHRVGSSQGYAPAQPIAFSHRLHAGVNQIPCLYCHFAAERSRHAGIPPLNVCMNCHSKLKLASAELQKLKEAVAQDRPIRWVKIHNLPDFVYFNHSQHVVVAKLACQRCHGPVETMNRVAQQAPLTMGWCIGCHRSEGVLPPGVHPGAASGMWASWKPGRGMGGQDCSKCHY
jgi:nitrate reductase gamma subunit